MKLLVISYLNCLLAIMRYMPRFYVFSFRTSLEKVKRHNGKVRDVTRSAVMR
jgi:hypothetical protein